MVGRHHRSPAPRHAVSHTVRHTASHTARRALAPLAAASVAVLAAAPLASAAPAAPAAPQQPADQPPCSDAADVCVDLGEQRAWLTDDGRATSGPMAITSGSDEDPTPTGEFTVQRKERHHVSREFGRAPMPYSVFFDDEGRALHSGSRAGSSHGCVRLDKDDAQDVFAALEPGDRVEIVR
ncbi:L,D-transpeptidase [Actinomycetospora straminea]|uniref:L,D-TPase catalytic domain-containing protein n=1 Tax=Actinomycetospora straminea TaxID=663607 RepID=A0ABP9E087_9PSEU|nr:L,D-transpeptidase [Actinomycetospora straminea]MDD7931065.1 L,D-transpeptidase [Actinomycetospora straminea]